MRAIIWAAVSTKAQASKDKESLQSQVKLAREICDKNDWKVIDVLQVPGHSRRYIDIYKLAETAQRDGINAFSKLLDHFTAQDFDLLIVRDGDRFARTQTLHSMIVESTINIGARIYSLSDGMIDESNFRMWIAMGGYRAAGEVDNMLKKIKVGYDARFKRGLPVNANIVSTHKIIRDPSNGKAIGIEFDKSQEQEFNDLASLILEGIGWKSLEIEMYNRFGYARDKGGAHQPQRYYRMLCTPSFWGHLSRGHKSKSKGSWVFEAGHKVPDNVEIIYDAFEPVYKGELAERVKSEIRRRQKISGKRSPNKSYKLSGLVICGECTYAMGYSRKGNYIGLRCNSIYEKNPSTPACNHRAMLNEKRAIEQVNEMLLNIIDEQALTAIVPGRDGLYKEGEQLLLVNEQVESLQDEILVMINQQARAPKNLQDSYRQSIKQAGERLDILKKRQETLKQQVEQSFTSNKREQDAIIEITRLIDEFWQLPNNKINQLLEQLLGDYRFVSLNGEIIGIALSPR